MELTESRIIHGDCHEWIPQLPDESFSLLLADPPYEISIDSNVHTMGRAGFQFGEWDKDFDQLAWITLALPKIKPGGSLVIWNDWKKLGLIAEHLKSELGLKDFKGFRPLVWHKANPNPLNCKVTWTQGTEFAVWVKKPGGKTTYNAGYHHGVFKYPINKTAQHRTKKQDGLFQEIIEALTNPEDWVLDPFIGGGTTSYAAEKSGRNFIGIELDKDYFSIASSHWEKAKTNV
jgi:DNA modification methylase